ncbi:MAG: Histidine ABC transporter, permease protein HisQ (TC 3.A.1.3.1) [uncultured Caballeronia sp.]|nr:MAG: Histidine ABC transporter, permease protein HisQ (TC 3.A.1.3.1) [uncultured Caballeronia sp.]
MVAAAKLSRSRTLRIIGDAYTRLFRGIPELLIIYLFYFGGSSALTGSSACRLSWSAHSPLA